MFGGVLSLILYIFLFIMIVVSLLGLFDNTPSTMTQTKILFENWDHRDIKFKDLVDLGFPLPVYDLNGDKYYSVNDFNINGMQAVDYGSNPPDLQI